ncbi:MAG: hypothetical protein JST20_00695 [Bacteroidetes bacterium]|nr:hypothetical protein [Bacteroidota bacterium]
MRRSLQLGSVGISALIGTVLVLGLSYISGSKFATPPFPIMAILSGFIVTGIVAGIISKEKTILEPGIAAIIVSIISAFVLPSFQLKGLMDMNQSSFWLVLANGVIITFMGAWAGEYIQGEEDTKAETSSIEWGWIICGGIIGVAVSMLLASSVVVLLGGGFLLSYHLVAFIVGLFCTGMLVGWRSPGITIREAALAGFLTVIIDLDAIMLTLGLENDQLQSLLMFGAAIGVVVALIGGFIGEKIQSN